MSSSERAARPLARLCLAAASLAALLSIGACTVQPLYGTAAPTDLSGAATAPADVAALRSQLAVAATNDRTSQIFRNALIFRLYGGKAPATPTYEVRYVITGQETVVSIQQGSGVPSASTYRMTGDYQLVRLSDGQPVGGGRQFVTVPFDRSEQLYASARALVDARDQAGSALAARIELALMKLLRKELKT